MKEKINIKNIYESSEELIDKRVMAEGWIKTSRISKNIGFIEINDGTTFANFQIVYNENTEDFERIKKYRTGMSVKVTGILKESPKSHQDYELIADKIELTGDCENDYPLQKKYHSLEYLRTIPHIRPRANTYMAVFRLRSSLFHAIHKFFMERDFLYVTTPIITANDSEGAGKTFGVISSEDNKNDCLEEFFGKKTNLTVSGQLEAEIFAMSHRKVYTFGPTFRAENSNTGRHAAEFWMLEPEMSFADINDNMDIAEEMIKYLAGYVLENNSEELLFFNSHFDMNIFEKLKKLRQIEFERITYDKAVELLSDSGKDFNYDCSWGSDLQTEHERYIAEEIYDKPVFVINYPKEIKAFYMRENNDGKTVAAMDLLVPGVGELIGGSQREERYEYLKRKMDEGNLLNEEMNWYLELRKYGCPVHSGFGLGFDRLLMYFSGISNIRDVIPFPRTPKNLII